MDDLPAGLTQRLVDIRRRLHADPELSRAEERTAAFVAAQLEEAGIAVLRGFGGHGVVGIVEGRAPGLGVALRADMDALEITEENDLPYRSRNSGRMHACGHDGHVAMLLGVAFRLAETRDFAGTVYLLFQPAEERFGGAQLMLDHGLLERFSIDRIFGLHNWPTLPEGRIVVQDGPAMAGSSEFDITFSAKGGHAAMPHMTGDPIYAGGHFMTTIQGAVARHLDPLDPGVVTIGSFQAGYAQNIIPERAVLAGTLRGFRTPVIKALRERVRVVAAASAAIAGTSHEILFDDPMIPPVTNTRAEAAIMRAAAVAVAGEDVLLAEPPTMAGDDFGVFLQHRPGAYAFVGSGPVPEGSRLHQPRYDFNDAIIPLGVRFLVETAKRALLTPMAAQGDGR